MKFKVINFYGMYLTFSVNLVRRFRVLKSVPKCWEEICGCTTQHGTYESGNTTIYQSKTTRKYYMVRYFDGCFNEMYAEVSGIDWRSLTDNIKSFWTAQSSVQSEMRNLRRNGEISDAEENFRYARMRKNAENVLLRMVG